MSLSSSLTNITSNSNKIESSLLFVHVNLLINWNIGCSDCVIDVHTIRGIQSRCVCSYFLSSSGNNHRYKIFAIIIPSRHVSTTSALVLIIMVNITQGGYRSGIDRAILFLQITDMKLNLVIRIRNGLGNIIFFYFWPIFLIFGHIIIFYMVSCLAGKDDRSCPAQLDNSTPGRW